MNLYPFKFKPYLKETIWGGDKICRFKNYASIIDGIGESWEISAVEGCRSVVANGALAGKSISELIDIFGAKLLGDSVYECFGNHFPLLIKFIDSNQPLSVQVHPNDVLAQIRHGGMGKSEMWYVIDAEKDAYIFSGFSKKLTPEKYAETVANGDFVGYLKRYEAKAGDVFYLPAGQVHAIGPGCLIAEIQQSSDITYRIFDYNRIDKNGQKRELHTELAFDAINYSVGDNTKIQQPSPTINEWQTLVACPYFTTQIYRSSDYTMLKAKISDDSFEIYICISGKATIEDIYGNREILCKGDTALLGAKTIKN